MAKYESPCQVLGLFVGAILVSCGVIYILTLEANKRYGNANEENQETEKVVVDVPLIREKRSLKFEISGSEEGENRRWMTWSGDKDPNNFMDWSVDSKGNFFMDIPLKPTQKEHDNKEVMHFDSDEKTKNGTSIINLKDDDDDDEFDGKYASDLSENLLTEGLKRRKIRNIEEKIAWLKNDDQVVAEIVRQFCPKPSSTTMPPTSLPENKTETNSTNTANDVGWHDVDTIFVFDEDTYQEDDKIGQQGKENKKDSKKMNHADDIPPLLLERNVNIRQPHVTWTNHDGTFERGTAPDRNSGVKCESESEILLTVAITTVVNFLFFGFIMIAKSWICDSFPLGKDFGEDGTPFVNNDDYCGDDNVTCNCMDENCPNSVTPPYDRMRVPYKRFVNEPDVTGSVDVVGAAINSRGYNAANAFYPPNLSVNSGDILMSSTYPPQNQYPFERFEETNVNGSNRFYNSNLTMQGNLPMQHHMTIPRSVPNSTLNCNLSNEQTFMDSPSFTVRSAPKNIPEEHVEFSMDRDPIII